MFWDGYDNLRVVNGLPQLFNFPHWKRKALSGVAHKELLQKYGFKQAHVHGFKREAGCSSQGFKRGGIVAGLLEVASRTDSGCILEMSGRIADGVSRIGMASVVGCLCCLCGRGRLFLFRGLPARYY